MHTSRLTRQVLAACGTGVLLLGATACGDDGANDSKGTDGDASGQTQQYGGDGSGPQNGTGPGAMPGANGKVAAIDGSTAQVQSQLTGQVAVTWNASTTFTKQVAASLADVKAGDCVMVEPTEDSASSGESPPTEVTAATVRITEQVNGSCTPALRGGGLGDSAPQTQGSGPQVEGDGPGSAPDGSDGAPPRAQLRGFGAFGEVKDVTANGFTVTTTLPNDADDNETTTEVTVTVDRNTTYTTMAKGAASDVEVGVCVRADGTTDSTGAVTAKSIAVTPAVDGECGGMVFQRDAPGADSGTSSGTVKES